MNINSAGELSSLPVEIQEFYTEDGTCKPRGSTQANTVYQLVNNRSLERVEQFLAYENNGIAWAFHDAYISWKESEPIKPGKYQPDITVAEQEVIYAKWEASKPIRLPAKTLEDFPEYFTWLKLRGVEFEGVMCSATKEDYWGLGTAYPWIKAGNATMWEFDNGNKLLLTPDNIDAFYAVWVPFRSQFFT